MRSHGLKLNCKHSTQVTVKSYKAEGFKHCLREGLMVEMSNNVCLKCLIFSILRHVFNRFNDWVNTYTTCKVGKRELSP